MQGRGESIGKQGPGRGKDTGSAVTQRHFGASSYRLPARDSSATFLGSSLCVLMESAFPRYLLLRGVLDSDSVGREVSDYPC